MKLRWVEMQVFDRFMADAEGNERNEYRAVRTLQYFDSQSGSWEDVPVVQMEDLAG